MSEYLYSLETSTVPTKSLLVSNGSENGTIESVERNYARAHVDENVNLGCTGGSSYGVLSVGGDVAACFFLNPDAAGTPSSLEDLSSALSDVDPLEVNGPPQRHLPNGWIDYVCALIDFAQPVFMSGGYEEVNLGPSRAINQSICPAGAVKLGPRIPTGAVGPVAALYFLYWKECEWTWRFFQIDLLIGYVPDAKKLPPMSNSDGRRGLNTRESCYARTLLRLEAGSKELSERASLHLLLPLLAQRWEIVALRKLKPLITAVPSNCLSVAKYLRDPYSRHACLTVGAKLDCVTL